MKKSVYITRQDSATVTPPDAGDVHRRDNQRSAKNRLTNEARSAMALADSLESRAELDHSLRTLGDQLRRSYLESTRALVAAVEARDPYTHDHSQRVSHYAKTIATRMRLDCREVSRIETAAILHDIGKIGVPDSILRKTDKLLPEEFEVIRCHPAIGVKILAHNTYLRRELPIILHHHEKYDGSGYPDGLAGERIPIGARVLAAADALDAMLSRRAYRPALSMQEARSELSRQRGTQFDPEVVDVLLDWLDEMDAESNSAPN
ncbi:MAG TPA: HD domain-containing protein [Phycisphaerae bacterium]|nr:HD domain-containing protein [Phycisphaerae bacterium]